MVPQERDALDEGLDGKLSSSLGPGPASVRFADGEHSSETATNGGDSRDDTSGSGLPVCKGLTEFDKNGDGFIDEEEMEAFSKKVRLMGAKMKVMRRTVLALACMVLFLLCAMFGTTYWATQLSKDLYVEDAVIVGGEQQALATVQKLDRLEGVHFAAARRLDDATNTLDANGVNASTNQTLAEESIQIEAGSFRKAYQAYKQGKASWIVALPDGTSRTVTIYGVDSEGAWGWCASCDPTRKLTWRVHCSEGFSSLRGDGQLGALNADSECSVTWTVLGETAAPDDYVAEEFTTDRRRALRGTAGPRDARLEELLRAASALQNGIARLQADSEGEEPPAAAVPQAQALMARAGRAGVGRHERQNEGVDRALGTKHCV